jgi:hypothetical protein
MAGLGGRLAAWTVALLCFFAAPAPGLAQAVSLYYPPGDSLAGSSVQVSRWISDVGVCTTPPCITHIPESIDFLGSPPAIAQVDASEGFLNSGSHTPGPWNLSKYTGITFYYEDLNAKNSHETSQYSHYFLIYDNNNCYRAWYLDLVGADGLPLSDSPGIIPNVWYQVSGSFSTALGTYVRQGGTPLNGVACNSKPLNFSAIIYFESGIFGGPMAAHDGINYHWRVGGVTPFSAPP